MLSAMYMYTAWCSKMAGWKAEDHEIGLEHSSTHTSSTDDNRSHDIVEARGCISTNESHLKSKKCNKNWVKNVGNFNLKGLRQSRRLKVSVKVVQLILT